MCLNYTMTGRKEEGNIVVTSAKVQRRRKEVQGTAVIFRGNYSCKSTALLHSLNCITVKYRRDDLRNKISVKQSDLYCKDTVFRVRVRVRV